MREKLSTSTCRQPSARKKLSWTKNKYTITNPSSILLVGVIIKLAQKRIILLVVLLRIISSALFSATAEATYFEESNTTILKSSDYGIESTGFDYALHVCTLTIRSIGTGDAPQLYALRLDRSSNFGVGVEYWLKNTEPIRNNETEFGAQLIAKTMYDNKTIEKTINGETGEDHLTEGLAISSSKYPITIKFYVGIRNLNSSQAARRAGFQFKDSTGPNLANFKIMYRLTSEWGTYYTISIGGSTAPQPFFSTNYNENSLNYLNREVLGKTRFVSLSIEQIASEQSINLLNASGTSKAKVGQARLTRSGFDSPSTPGVTITFADGNGSTDTNFRLKHTQGSSFIPFILYFAWTKVDRGVPITWGNLVYGTNNLKDLEVGGINYQNSASAMGGAYSDTIFVTITPVDTNLEGL